MTQFYNYKFKTGTGDGFSRSYQNVDSIALIHKNEAFIVDLDKINEQSTIVLEENIVESVDMYSVKRLVDLARQFDFATISNESVYVWSVKEMTADKGRNFLPVVIYNNKKYIIPVFNYISTKDILANKDSSFNKFLDTILNEKL